MIKVGIVGSRNFNDLNMVKEYVKQLKGCCDTIVIGEKKGVEETAEKMAKELGIEVISIKPNWKKYGRRTEIVRNKEICETSDMIASFWDGKSKGTLNTINTAKKMNMLIEEFPDDWYLWHREGRIITG